jgi:hypothetical protein
MFEHMDVRVRRGRRSASIAGQSRQQDVAETIASSAMVLATFAETKVARSPWRRAEKDMDVELQSTKATHRVRNPSPAALRAATSPTRGEVNIKVTGLQSPSMDFALRANLRLSKFVPDEFVRPAPE